MTIQVEIVGDGAQEATEALLALPEVEGAIAPVAEVERGEPLTVLASIVGIVGGTLAIAEQIRQWYAAYCGGKGSKPIEKVLIVNGSQRLLLENATTEQIKALLDAS